MANWKAWNKGTQFSMAVIVAFKAKYGFFVVANCYLCIHVLANHCHIRFCAGDALVCKYPGNCFLYVEWCLMQTMYCKCVDCNDFCLSSYHAPVCLFDREEGNCSITDCFGGLQLLFFLITFPHHNLFTIWFLYVCLCWRGVWNVKSKIWPFSLHLTCNRYEKLERKWRTPKKNLKEWRKKNYVYFDA